MVSIFDIVSIALYSLKHTSLLFRIILSLYYILFKRLIARINAGPQVYLKCAQNGIEKS